MRKVTTSYANGGWLLEVVKNSSALSGKAESPRWAKCIHVVRPVRQHLTNRFCPCEHPGRKQRQLTTSPVKGELTIERHRGIRPCNLSITILANSSFTSVRSRGLMVAETRAEPPGLGPAERRKPVVTWPE